ncbi:MAG: hypothetical protein U0525_06375, partial [Patescibacteria group bacterium]
MANQKNNNKQKNPGKPKIRKFQIKFDIRTIFIGFLVLMIISSIWGAVSDEMSKKFPEKPISEIIQDVKQNKVDSIEIVDSKVILKYKGSEDKYATATKEEGESFLKTLKDQGIDLTKTKITVKSTSGTTLFLNLLGAILPALLTVGLLLFLFRQARGAQENIFSFGQNKAKRFNKSMTKITF